MTGRRGVQAIPMNTLDPLGGALWVRAGEPRPHNLRSTRPDWVDRATRGRPARALPDTLGRLFALCSRAHAVCAGLALQAAQQGRAEVTPALRGQLAAQTVRDHAQQIWLDWPGRLLPPTDAAAFQARAAVVLGTCPAFGPAAAPGALADWLQTHALGLPPAAWLSRWDEDPPGWLRHWSDNAPGELPRLLRHCRAVAETAAPGLPALQVHASDAALQALAGEIQAQGARFARQPLWRGWCAETGVWTRLHDAAGQRLHSAWLRLGARLAEAVRLALPDEPGRCGADWLALGALPLADGSAIAWVEMARGLLLHHLQLDGSGADARVAACHVIAPTEWNFHPDGAVARAVEALPRQPDAEAWRGFDALVAAYAPCVPLQHAPSSLLVEVAHA